MSDTQTRVINGVVVVMPALEPAPIVFRSVGAMAVFVLANWAAFSVGAQLLSSGVMVHLGPFAFGFCHIDKQRNAFASMPDDAAEITRLRAELARVTALGEGLADRVKLIASARDNDTCAALAAWQGRGDGEG
jgi:hypothetical protein